VTARRGARSGRSATGAPPAEQGPAHTPADQDMTIVVTQPSAAAAEPGLAAPDAPRVHPTAIIEPGVTIGPRSTIGDGVHVRAPSAIGRDCVVGEKTHIADGVTIGDGVKINTHVHICSGVTIESSVMIAAGVVFTNERYPRATDYPAETARAPLPEALKTVVRTGATIGAGALVGPGVDIGPWSMIGMGAVVTRDVVPHALVVGAPARVAGWVCVCGTPLGGAAIAAPALCKRCGRRYRVVYGPRGRILSPIEPDR
jgi:UDP-2-acetamido-3-amino-2,3-dideoxy-glucuronate N-acetyltransferase